MAKNMEMDDDIENVGIMQGFLDEMGDDMEEEENGDEENSAAKMLDRRPNSPEILMNNLRGDMRSIDARREELADLVGYAAAVETPDSVLAMLQPVLAQGGGLGALPESMPMAQGPQAPMPPPPGPMSGPPPGLPPVPPEAMMPPPSQDGGIAALLAAGAPGGGQAPPQAPIGMKKGGLVQHFYNGSDEEGVTQAEEDNSPSGMQVTPDMLELARAGYNRLLTQRAAPEVDLRTRTAEREKLYQELLGDDKDMQQAQLLLMLGQKGLQLAGNVDAQGRPLRGSTLGRFATVAAEVPGAISQFISDVDKRQNAIRMAAIQSAEKEAEQTREGNLKLIESQRKAFGDVLKNSKMTPSSLFGKGAWDWSVVNTPGLLQAYADGETDPEQDNLITSAASRLLRERKEQYTNELGQIVTRTIPGYDLPFLRDALAQRNALDAAGPRQAPTTPGTVPVGPRTVAPDRTTEAPVADETPASTDVTAGERQFAEPTLWGAAQQGIGFIPKITSELARRVPLEIAGEMGRTQQQAAATVSKLAPRVSLALRETTRLSNSEREDINMYLNIDPKLFENRIGYLNNLVSLGQVLYRIRNDALDKSSDRTLAVKDANEQRLKARDIQGVIDLVGIPPVVSTREEYIRLPIGAQFLVYNREKQAWVPDTRKPLPDEQ
jgi:hypothetical protein